MKQILNIFTALFFNTFVGVLFAFTIGANLFVGAAVAVTLGFVPVQHLTGTALFAGVLKEIWTGELIKKFRHNGSFLSVIMGRDDLVNNDAIHLVDVGADPDVLINNTTYPIAIVSRTDDDVVIALDKFDTENTSITDDELYAITYDKIGSVVEQHNEVLEDKTIEKAIHALAPAGNTSNTPVIQTSGSTSGTIKRAAIADIISMKRKFDDLKVPKQNRHVILCNQHIEDLLNTNEAFAQQYMNPREGQLLKLHGFTIWEEAYNPVYDKTALTKGAYDAVVGADDRPASIFFYAQRVFKARGSVKMYYADASTDPEYRRTVAGFRLYFICLPKKNLGFGALVTKDA